MPSKEHKRAAERIVKEGFSHWRGLPVKFEIKKIAAIIDEECPVEKLHDEIKKGGIKTIDIVKGEIVLLDSEAYLDKLSEENARLRAENRKLVAANSDLGLGLTDTYAENLRLRTAGAQLRTAMFSGVAMEQGGHEPLDRVCRAEVIDAIEKWDAALAKMEKK